MVYWNSVTNQYVDDGKNDYVYNQQPATTAEAPSASWWQIGSTLANTAANVIGAIKGGSTVYTAAPASGTTTAQVAQAAQPNIIVQAPPAETKSNTGATIAIIGVVVLVVVAVVYFIARKK